HAPRRQAHRRLRANARDAAWRDAHLRRRAGSGTIACMMRHDGNLAGIAALEPMPTAVRPQRWIDRVLQAGSRPGMGARDVRRIRLFNATGWACGIVLVTVGVGLARAGFLAIGGICALVFCIYVVCITVNRYGHRRAGTLGLITTANLAISLVGLLLG